ncbi:hypothetical protein Verru16b_03157 [Lacunisphaera limnophila]|uniref:Tetratricopeptide repeat protein n=1 Tax=Lacunisphaera limnophila TaxID=1838286 RepID=A0A1D8AYT2_9BACT|nr:hypothetical protein [Lacunisphaera limnophila]AOS46062.1 hypothetical protein Verru16b_03157 [Lacunisphaera limnophila]
MARYWLLSCLSLAITGIAAPDYRQITTFTGPCVRELAVMAKEGDITSARAQARALCRSDAEQSCPDLWLVYAYCEIRLDEPGVLEICEDVARRLPKSAAAHMLHLRAIIASVDSGNVIQSFTKLKKAVRSAEYAVACDPDCHTARIVLIMVYSMPKLFGGDTAKLKLHLSELSQRSAHDYALVQGMLQVRLDNHAAAIMNFEEAKRLDPSNRHPVMLMIKSKVEMGDYDGAFTLCKKIEPEFTGDGQGQEKFVELSAQSLLHVEEALVASREYLETAKGITPEERAKVLAHTAIILKSIGRVDESKQRMEEARRAWKNVDDHVKKLAKKYHKQGSKVVAR